MELVHPGGGQTDAPQGQGLPVVLAEQAAARVHRRQHMVIGPQQKEMAHRVAVVAGDLADRHLVQRHGDSAHAVLGQHQPQQPGKLLAVQLRVAQDLHELVQHAAEDLPQLAVLLRQLQLSCLLELSDPLPQGLRQPDLLQISVKHFYFFLCARVLFQPVMERFERRPHPAAQSVDLP